MKPSLTSSSSSTSITSLPRAILLKKILTGLPAKSAVRFRCTSKFFYSSIPEPRFAFRILVSLPSIIPPALNLYSVSYSEESHGSLRAKPAQRLGVRGLVCSADGKMCLLSNESGDDAAAVFDLSTGQRICLPSIDWPAGRTASSFSCSVCTCAVLGFDWISERYKVFKSTVYYDSRFRPVLNRLCVLTVGVDESWREIDSTISRYTQDAVHINGIIYLICWTRHSQSFENQFDSLTTDAKIIAMDVGTESFITSIPFIFEYESLQHWPGWLPWMKLNGHLAFVSILGPQKPSKALPYRIDIWMLEWSMEWEKHTILLPLEEREVIGEATAMGFTANSMGEIVFLIQSKRMMSPLVLVYSFEREVWRRFEIHGVCNFLDFSTHTKSVVHVEDEIATFLK